MITAEGYSKDPSLIPEGIALTLGREMIIEKCGTGKTVSLPKPKKELSAREKQLASFIAKIAVAKTETNHAEEGHHIPALQQ